MTVAPSHRGSRRLGSTSGVCDGHHVGSSGMQRFKSFKELKGAFLGCEVGEWFGQREIDVIRAEGELEGQPFSRKKAAARKDGRKVIVYSEADGSPNVRVYPRTSDPEGPDLSHVGCEPKCLIDKPGRICFDVPCTVVADKLVVSRRSCMEPNRTLVVDLLAGASR